MLSTKYAFDARLLRATGNPFYRTADGQIANRYRLRLTNRTDETRRYQIDATAPATARIVMIETEELSLDQGESKLISISVAITQTDLDGSGSTPMTLELVDDLQNQRTVKATFRGPNNGS